ncbi:MAG: phosphate acyltransferase PlsX [candidate division Zixibacteria bacterium]|nr:phosphate acyltransferase PlsX [candidate division Zixibacteria bacterium]
MASPSRHTIVLDVMGADNPESCIIDGGLDVARRMIDSLHVTFVGQQEVINKALSERNNLPDNISVKHAERVVPMDASATNGVRMRDSSITVGLKLMHDKMADAFVSPGNTGAVMATSLLTLGRIKGVSRPAIASTFPTWTGKPTVVLDVGANADCKPNHISQFAIMGSVYSSVIYNIEAPRVGLLSIGEERSKGNELIFNALKLLKNSRINFVGNIEGRDILSGIVDVAVTDGFTGNLLLKFAESIKPMLAKSIQRQIQTNVFSRVGAMLLLPFLKRMRNSFDYAESGGAPLLGVNGPVIISHGSSNSRAISNAIKAAHEMVSGGVLKHLHRELVTNHFGHENGIKDKSENNRNRVIHASTANDKR